MKALLCCVTYPGLSDQIVIDYVESIRRQNDQGFDWLLINDHGPKEQLGLFPQGIKLIQLDTVMSFGYIRKIGIEYAVNHGYDCVLFSDIDDYYSANRVELTKSYLKRSDFVFTEIQVVDFEKRLMHRDLIRSLGVKEHLTGIEDILHFNYIGLSHSAARTSALKHFEIPENLEVVDWWIFTYLLMFKHDGRFIPEADTFYRQSADNYVGVYSPLDEKRLLRGVDAKLRHYSGLVECCERHALGDMSRVYRERQDEMLTLKRSLADEKFMSRYVQVINANFKTIYKGWWSEILPIKQWERYDK